MRPTLFKGTPARRASSSWVISRASRAALTRLPMSTKHLRCLAGQKIIASPTLDDNSPGVYTPQDGQRREPPRPFGRGESGALSQEGDFLDHHHNTGARFS